MQYFQTLGNNLEQKWLKENYDEETFPQLALNALEQAPPHEHVKATDIMDFLFDPRPVIRQPDYRDFFGEPPILLFQSPRFYIEALFWFSGTTAIHEHSFSGAFSVLCGSSVHSHWEFRSGRTINSRMLCGRLERISTEILQPGSIRPIQSGDRLIHQLFHLDIPSVTIVVRTHEERNRLPQHSYFLPGLAIAHGDYNGLLTRRSLLLDGMARVRTKELRNYVRKVIESGELETLYHTLSILSRRKENRDLLGEMYSLASERHGEIIDLFRRVHEEERRTRIVTALRSKVTAPEPRFLLALLMLMPDRDAIFETIRLQFPDVDPLSAIEAWLDAMPGKETIGFNLTEINRAILRSLAEGKDMEGVMQRLSDLRKDSPDADHERLVEHVKRIAKSDLFKPLFSGSPLLEERRAA